MADFIARGVTHIAVLAGGNQDLKEYFEEFRAVRFLALQGNITV